MKVRAAILLLVSVGLIKSIYAQEAEVSHDQYYIVPQDHCESGDVVGQFYVNCTDTIFNDRESDYSFEIIGGNSNNAFSINSEGLITVANPTAIQHGNDFELEIGISAGEMIASNMAEVKVLHPDSVIFIDPHYSGSENGSRSMPYNNWNSDIRSSRLYPGFAYLWKRGTVSQTGDNIYVGNSSTKVIHIGAYGKGARPVLDGRNTHDNNGVLIGASWSCPADASSAGWNIIMLDMVIRGFNADDRNSVRMAPSVKNIQLHRLKAEGGHYNGCYYLGKECNFEPQNILVQDCEAKNNPVSHLIKSEAGGVDIINFWGYGAPNGTGISFPVSPNNTAKYFKLGGIGETGINIRKANTHFQYGLISGGYRGAYIYYDGAREMYPDNSSLKNLIFENTYSYAVLVEDGDNLLLEGIEVRNTKTSAIAVRSDIDGLEISKCRIYNNSGHGIDITGNSNNIVVDYNIIYNNTNNGVNLASSGNAAKLHNNILVNNGGADAMNTSGHEADFINNVYGDISNGWGAYTNNHNINNEACYENPAAGNFKPLKTSYIVNNGADLGYERDFFGIRVPQNDAPDIGAVEFYEGDPSDGGFGSGEPDDSNITPSIEAQSLDFNAVEGSAYVGKVIASDENEEQSLSYSILPGTNSGLFTIDELTGEINCPVIDFDPYQPHAFIIEVQISDNGDPALTSSAEITINITPGAKVVYIDPSVDHGTQETGSLSLPYNSWSDIEWKAGFTYLQKKGTQEKIDKLLLSGSDIKIGAYGDGEKPILEYEGSEFAIKTYERSNLIIEGVHIKAYSAVSCIYFSGSSSDSIYVRDCELEGASHGVRAIDIKSLNVSYSKFTQLQEAIYSYADKTEVFYNIFAENNIGLNVASPASEVLVYNNVFSDNLEGMTVGYSSSTIYNNIFYLAKPGDVALNHTLDKFVSDNNIFYPEQQGFLKIANEVYDELSVYQKTKGLDLNSFTRDPKFVDIYAKNFDVTESSPALNNAVDLGQERDFLGNLVPYGGKPDIGAIEKQLDAVLGTRHIDSDNEFFTVFPNPASDYVSVKLENAASEPYTLEVLNIEGKTVMSREIEAERNIIREIIDLSKYTAGTYIISLISNSELISNKFTVY